METGETGKSVPLISECSRQTVGVKKIQFNRNLLGTFHVSGAGICH